MKSNPLAMQQLDRGARHLEKVAVAIQTGMPAENVAFHLNNCLHALTCLGREVAAARHNEKERNHGPADMPM